MKGLLTLLVGLVTFTAAQADPQVYYYHLDQLGTPQALTDANQAVVWRADYEPFGQATVTLQNGINNPIRFPGQYYDAETGLHYNYFRDYNPSTGRYVQSDPIGLGGALNTYAYVNGTPLQLTDPLGLWSTGGHHEIIDSTFNRTPDWIRDQIKAGSDDIDAWYKQFQHGLSPQHAMTDPGQDPRQALKEMCKFIKRNLDVFRDLRNDPQLKIRQLAYRHLGRALHPIMDSTSPAHAGFQPWNPIADFWHHGDMPGTIEDNKDLTAEIIAQNRDLIDQAINGQLCLCNDQ